MSKIVITEEQEAQVEALASCLTTEQIADYLGIGKTTFYNHMKNNESLSVRYKKGKARTISEIGNNLLTLARQGDLGAICFYLKTRAGWRETSRHEITSPDGSMTPNLVVLPADIDMSVALKKYK